ncbi:thiamine phosphate synthase [Corynebacterium occultum]
MISLPVHGSEKTLDLRCYVVTGTADHRRTVEVARAAAAGGAGVIQVRSKPITARELGRLAEEIAYAVASLGSGTHVLIDDRVDVTAALMRRGVPIHGVHLGQQDLPVRDARELLGPAAIIGLTTGTLELVQAVHRVADVVDYIGAGPFRPTPTKDSGRPPLGIAGYPPLVAESPVPVVAIGDVTPADVPELAVTGIAGVAISRGFMEAAAPDVVAAEVLAGFMAGRSDQK